MNTNGLLPQEVFIEGRDRRGGAHGTRPSEHGYFAYRIFQGVLKSCVHVFTTIHLNIKLTIESLRGCWKVMSMCLRPLGYYGSKVINIVTILCWREKNEYMVTRLTLQGLNTYIINCVHWDLILANTPDFGRRLQISHLCHQWWTYWMNKCLWLPWKPKPSLTHIRTSVFGKNVNQN